MAGIMAAVTPFIPLITSGLGAIGGMFGGGQGDTTQHTPQLPGQVGAANNVLGGIQGLGQNNVAQELLPQYRSVVQGLQSNPYGMQAQQGANAAAGQGQQTAGQAGQASNSLFGLTQSMIPYAQQLGVAAFDPQQGLYNRTLQQTQDQQRVGQSARGVAMTPYGAGLENDALKNFNIDWQNNALQRMLAGVQGMGQASNDIGAGFNNAGSLGANAAQLFGQSAQLPYQTLLGQGQDQLTLLNALSGAGTQANAVPQQQIMDLLQYLGAANAANSTATGASQAAFGQNQTLGSNLGGSIGAFGDALGGIDWTKLFGGGAPAGGGGRG